MCYSYKFYEFYPYTWVDFIPPHSGYRTLQSSPLGWQRRLLPGSLSLDIEHFSSVVVYASSPPVVYASLPSQPKASNEMFLVTTD